MFEQRKSFLSLTISFLLGIVIFLVILWIANHFIATFNNQAYSDLIQFFRDNITLLISISLIFFIGDIFLMFYSPINFLAPIFKAFGSILLVPFIFHLLYLVNTSLNLNLASSIKITYIPVLILIPLMVLITGYASIIIRAKKDKLLNKEMPKNKIEFDKEAFKEEMKKEMANVKVNVSEAVQKAIKEAKIIKKKNKKSK